MSISNFAGLTGPILGLFLGLFLFAGDLRPLPVRLWRFSFAWWNRSILGKDGLCSVVYDGLASVSSIDLSEFVGEKCGRPNFMMRDSMT